VSDGKPSLVILACGALARELTAIVVQNRLAGVKITCLPAKLHNRPQLIPELVRRKIHRLRELGAPIFCAYGDCGTGGELDAVLAEEGVEHLPGAHCYAFYAGLDAFEAMHDAEPGTFYLTDYLTRHFHRLIVEGLGLEPGGLAFRGQSGWVSENVMEMGYERGLRFSKVVSIGNQSDLAVEDVLEYLANDAETRAIGLYVEGLKHGRDFVRVARQASRRKPVILWKAGRTPTGVRAAASHTGSLAGNVAVFAGALAQTGVIPARGLDELLDLMGAFSSPLLPAGKRVALLVEAGGGAVSGSDAAESLGLDVPTFSTGCQQELLRVLEGALPPFAPPRNPVDLVWPTRNAAAIVMHCARTMLGETDALVMLNYQPWDQRFVDSMVRLRDEAGKPVFIIPGHPVQRRAGIALLTRAGIPTFVTPEQAVRCLAAAYRYVNWRRPAGLPAAAPGPDQPAS